MNLAELGQVLDGSRRVLRIETLDRYAVGSDNDWPAAYTRGDPRPPVEAKQAWLDRLRGVADEGRPRLRVRLVPNPVPDYVRYACEWGYVDNVGAGEVVRVLDEADRPDDAVSARWVGDVYLADDRVIAMRYDEDGAFLRAEDTDDRERAATIENLWTFAEDFTTWWARRPELHRDPR